MLTASKEGMPKRHESNQLWGYIWTAKVFSLLLSIPFKGGKAVSQSYPYSFSTKRVFDLLFTRLRELQERSVPQNVVRVRDAHERYSVSAVCSPRPLCPSSLRLRGVTASELCPNVTGQGPAMSPSSKAALCSALAACERSSSSQGLALPEPWHRTPTAATRASLLPRRAKWGSLKKLRKGVILSVLLKHAVKPVFRKRRNEVKKCFVV